MKASNDVVLEVWKKTVEVQQHFNDIAIKIRNLAVTVLAAMLSASALSLKEYMTVIGPIPGTPLAIYLLSAALVAWTAFYMMDRFWYHRLLIGAVRHGESIEDRWRESLPEIELTRTIRKESAIELWKWNKKPVDFRSHTRIDVFYGLGAALLVASIWAVTQIEEPQNGQRLPATIGKSTYNCGSDLNSPTARHY